MKIAIRADGGPEIGYGHLIRTGALAQECLRRGDDVLYFTRTPDSVDQVLPEEVVSVEVSEENDLEGTIQYIKTYSIDVLFTDSFIVDTKYQKQIASTDAIIIVRHNYQHSTICCDLLVYGDLHAPELEYEWLGASPQFCLGPNYILLREEFQRIAQADSIWNETPKRALVVMGGSDVKNMTPEVMTALDSFNGSTDIVIGPGFTNVDEIKQASSVIDTDFNLLYNPDNMAEIMHRADFAIAACGGTVFELLATRTPFIGIPQVENQQQRAAALQNRELAFVVNDPQNLPSFIEKVNIRKNRRRLYDNINGIVDGKGAKRIRNKISNFM